MNAIYTELKAERDYQDGKWGHAFDDKNTLNDWMQYINIHGAKAAAMGVSKEEQRKQMVKVTALGIAALEAFDRNNGFAPRHYDQSELTSERPAAWPFPVSGKSAN